jgi:hypothetical protein
MIDTGRNYLTTTTIKMALDAMAYTKLNVLHWCESTIPPKNPNCHGENVDSPPHVLLPSIASGTL